MLTSALALVLLFPPVARPRDIWVFRSVLDQRARIVTVALHENLWIAYDATNCGLYRAWTGGVKFDGAVYTTVHGPQPTTFGNLHVPGIVDKPVWLLRRGGTEVPVKVEFKGYNFVKDQVVMNYRIRLDGKRTIEIRETPEAIPNGSVMGFERKFVVSGLSNGETLNLRTTVKPGFVIQGPNQRFDYEKMDDVAPTGRMNLVNGTTTLTNSFTIQPEGEVSRRGPAVAAEVEAPIQEPEQGPRQAGVAMRVYWIGSEMDKIPKLIGGQTPNYSVVVPKIDLEGPAAFGNVADDYLYVHFSGLLNVTKEGEYAFRLSSDDGSKFMIRDEVIVDHDGLHGADEPKEGKFRLSSGEHPFVLDYFENTVGESVKLEWKVPGTNEFVVVPESAFTTPEGEVRVTAPGKKTVFNAAKRWRPGDGLPLVGVHPSFDLETVRPKDFKPLVGGIDFLPDGRMVVCAWEPDGGVYVLDGTQAPKADNIKVTRIAAGLAEPLGIKVVNGAIYVLQKQELTRLRDTDGDGKIDEYYCVANGWGVTPNFHEFAFGLVYEKGYFYGNLATAIDPGGRSTQPQNQDRGKTIKIGLNGDFEFVASGLRTPNGIGKGYKGQIFITDNQGDWLPSSKLLHLKPGAFYGNRSVDPIGKKNTPEIPPVVWLPQNEIGNSPSQPTYLNLGPYKNQMIHGDVTHGGVKRVFVEEVGGELQGCVFRWTQGLEAGINRIAWGPDKALYVGGIGSTGNWGQEGKERFGLQRLTFNGKVAFEPLAVRAKTNGFEIELTKPLKEGLGEDPGDYSVMSWRYEPTATYGGPKIDEKNVNVLSVNLSADRKKVFLETSGVEPGQVVYIKMNRGLMSSDGQDLWTTEAWYTLNRVPEKSFGKTKPAVIGLSPAEEKEGFTLLGPAAWRGFKKDSFPKAWATTDGTLTLNPGVRDRGDLVTIEQFGDFDLRLEWKIEQGGNSGIIYRADEKHDATYHTGLEMQVLDDDFAPDGRSPLTSAGSAYAIYARTRDIVRPAGQWNRVRVVAKGNHIEHWLNGYKVLEYELWTADWKAKIANSVFATMPDYATLKKGHIALQDHGNRVSYRNARIKRL